jgi:ABC-type iron transport system FetAB ATPase subunit
MTDAPESKPLLRATALEVHGLAPVSLSLAAGECVALRGASGSGKTVLLRGLADLDPGAGQVFLEDRERNTFTGPQWRKQVRYLAAEPGWWADTPREHYSSPDGMGDIIEALGLTSAHLDRPLALLSTGERQRLALVRAIADAPPVLLLDEPTGALDGRAVGLAEDLLKRQLAGGTAILLVSHDDAQIERLAHRQLEINGGAVRGVAA